MSHEPKLTVYKIELKPVASNPRNNNKWLFRNLMNQANTILFTDSHILLEVFKKFISSLDTPEMFADTASKKCMTANQPNIEDSNVNPNIIPHVENYIIEGKVEGGSYGRKRSKTSTIDKSKKTKVEEGDAITEDFYFLLYIPFSSNKSVLMLQSYSDDSIDSVMKKFFGNFFSYPSQFNHPAITRFVPKSIIEDFKNNSTVSGLTFSTEVPSETLLEKTITTKQSFYKISVQVTPVDHDFTVEEFEKTIEPIEKTLFARVLQLGQFTKKTGKLKDSSTNKTSPFELGSSFDIKPTIMLSKYITLTGEESDFKNIKEYCLNLLESVKLEIYPQNGVQDR